MAFHCNPTDNLIHTRAKLARGVVMMYNYKAYYAGIELINWQLKLVKMFERDPTKSQSGEKYCDNI